MDQNKNIGVECSAVCERDARMASSASDEPEAKRAKAGDGGAEEESGGGGDEEMTVQFEDENGAHPFPAFSVPVSLGPEKLLVLLRVLLKQQREQGGLGADKVTLPLTSMALLSTYSPMLLKCTLGA